MLIFRGRLGIRKIFIKEDTILSEIMHENIVSLATVCNRPFAVVFKLFEFDFRLFVRDRKISSLDKFWYYLNSENLCDCFAGIGNCITVDLSNALSYLHKNDIMHTDIKPANILVSNRHYNKLMDLNLRNELTRNPNICLQQSNVVICANRHSIYSAKTKFVGRGYQPSMVTEIFLKEIQPPKCCWCLGSFDNVLSWRESWSSFPYQIMISCDNDVADAFQNCMRSKNIPSFSSKHLKH